jgi:hypothetical protein
MLSGGYLRVLAQLVGNTHEQLRLVGGPQYCTQCALVKMVVVRYCIQCDQYLCEGHANGPCSQLGIL